MVNQKRVALLTIPGWSNVESWLHVILSEHQIGKRTDVLSPNPWVLAILSSRDSIGNKLEKAGARFVLWLPDDRLFITGSFRSSVLVSRWMLFANRFDRNPISKNFFRGISKLFLARFGSVERAPAQAKSFSNVWPLFLTDVNSLLTINLPTDRKFCRNLVQSTLFSLYHGTLDLQLSDSPEFDLLNQFENGAKVLFATTPSQDLKYRNDYGFQGNEIQKISPPRHEALRELSVSTPRKSPSEVSVLFLTRAPREFPGFGWLESIRSVTNVIIALSQSGGGRLIVKPHPNEGRVSPILRLAASAILALRLNVNLQMTTCSIAENRQVDLALTWFTGLAVDLVVLGIPVYELRSKAKIDVGPKESSNELFDRLYEEKFCERIYSRQELRSKIKQHQLGLGSDETPKAQDSYKKLFYSVPHSTRRVGELIDEALT